MTKGYRVVFSGIARRANHPAQVAFHKLLRHDGEAEKVWSAQAAVRDGELLKRLEQLTPGDEIEVVTSSGLGGAPPLMTLEDFVVISKRGEIAA